MASAPEPRSPSRPAFDSGEEQVRRQHFEDSRGDGGIDGGGLPKAKLMATRASTPMELASCMATILRPTDPRAPKTAMGASGGSSAMVATSQARSAAACAHVAHRGRRLGP